MADEGIIDRGGSTLEVGQGTEAPQIELPQVQPFADRAEQGAEQFVQEFGSFAPESQFETDQVTSGAATGFFGTIGAGFDDSFVGWLMDSFNPFDASEEKKFQISNDAYSAANSWSAFTGNLLGRAVGDSPIDLAAGFGLGRLGAFAVRMSMSKNVATSSRTAIQTAATKLNQYYNGSSQGIKLADRITMEAVEGLITGAASESAAIAFGKSGDIDSVITAALGDMVASPVVSQILRAGWKGVSFATGGIKNKIAKAIEDTT